jgi:hypothetical protein
MGVGVLFDWHRVRRWHDVIFTAVGLGVIVLYTFLAINSDGPISFAVDLLLVLAVVFVIIRHWAGVILRYRRRPELPRNLRAIFPDGRTVPLDLVYAGKYAGLHHWTTAHHYNFTGVERVALEYLPPQTAVDFYGYAEPGSAMPRVTRDGDET